MAPGTTTITATSGGQSGSIVITVIPGNCAAQAVAGTIAVGESQSSSLGSHNCLFEAVDRRSEGWLLQVATSARVQIDVASDAFDTALLLTDVDLLVFGFDDDGGADSNSRLVWQLGTGSYYLWVSRPVVKGDCHRGASRGVVVKG